MSRAVVLSGGGPVGIGWQTGLAAGLASKGVDLREADFIVGTSAGSAVGARLALGRDMGEATERYREQLRAVASGESNDAVVGADMVERLQTVMKTMGAALASAASPEEAQALIAKFALEADTQTEEQFVTRFADLVGAPFPDGYACTSVDLHTGEFQVWDASSAVPLERAVASSCSIPGIAPPIKINGRYYMDGGARSVTNADLAKGHDRVLIVTLSSPARAAANPDDPRAERTREQMEHERAILLDAGAQLEVIGPDDDTSSAMGPNLMDVGMAPAAADAGFRQGQSIASNVEGFWS